MFSGPMSSCIYTQDTFKNLVLSCTKGHLHKLLVTICMSRHRMEMSECVDKETHSTLKKVLFKNNPYHKVIVHTQLYHSIGDIAARAGGGRTPARGINVVHINLMVRGFIFLKDIVNYYT